MFLFSDIIHASCSFDKLITEDTSNPLEGKFIPGKQYFLM